MTEQLSLRLFLASMLLCAGSALTLIWGGPIEQRLVPSFFIVGFASFLVWATCVVYRFLAK